MLTLVKPYGNCHEKKLQFELFECGGVFTVSRTDIQELALSLTLILRYEWKGVCYHSMCTSLSLRSLLHDHTIYKINTVVQLSTQSIAEKCSICLYHTGRWTFSMFCQISAGKSCSPLSRFASRDGQSFLPFRCGEARMSRCKALIGNSRLIHHVVL